MKVTIKVAAVITNENGDILLIKEKYDQDRGLKWNLVKGTYDDANETIVDCVKREIKEEVGLTVKEVKLGEIYHYGDAENPRVLFIFYVNKYEGEVLIESAEEQGKRDENIISANWFSKEDLEKIPEGDYMAPYVWKAIKSISVGESVEIEKIDWGVKTILTI